MTTSAPPTTGFGHDFLLPPVAVPIQPPAQPGFRREEQAPTPTTPPAAQPVGQRAAASSLATSPRAFISRNHEAILIRLLDDRLAPRLLEMYLNFQPRPCFQGLPPIKDEVCRKWVQGMIQDGINLVALSFEQGVVGHTALFPIDDAVCEMLVVVSHVYQNTGIGTELVRCSTQLAYEVGFERVWLPVESTNVRARHVYKKCGFDYLPGKQARELEMALDLRRYRDAVSVPVESIMSREVATVGLDDSCRAALDRILRCRAASLPVVDEQGVLQGVLSEGELLVPSNLDKQVRDIFTRQTLSVCPTCTVAKLVRLFQSSRVRSVPVIDGEKRLVGIVGRRDILAHYAEHMA